MSEHTKGRLEAFTQESFSGWYALRDQDHFEVGSGDGGFDEGDARRLAACWNAFENVRTELVEAMIGTGAMQSASDSMSALPAVQSELSAARAQNEKLTAMVQEQDRMLGNKACATKECRELMAARALLREVIEKDDAGWIVLPADFEEKIRNYLDACDTLGDGNG